MKKPVQQFFVVLSVAFGTPTNVWPCRDALLEMLYPLTCGRHQTWDDAGLDEHGNPPIHPLWVKRLLSGILVLLAALISFFDPPFQDVLALIGAIGGGMLAFVMPPLAYLNLYAPPWSSYTMI